VDAANLDMRHSDCGGRFIQWARIGTSPPENHSAKERAADPTYPGGGARVARGALAARPGGSATPSAYRLSSGTKERLGLPTYSWRGRPMRACGSCIISRHCAIQPGSRPIANSTVNICAGNPSAR